MRCDPNKYRWKLEECTYLIFSPFNNKEIYTTLGILHCINLASIQEKTWINNIIHTYYHPFLSLSFDSKSLWDFSFET